MLVSLKKAIVRFPLASILVLAVTLLLFILIQGSYSTTIEETLWKLVVTGVIMFFFSIGVTLVGETADPKVKRRPLWQLLTLGLWVLFYANFNATFNGSEMFIYIYLTFLGTIAFVFIAPFLKAILEKKEHQWLYARYFFHISRVFFNSTIVWIAMLLLWFAAIASVFALFDLTGIDSGKLYGYWAVISCVLTAGIFGLHNIPETKEKALTLDINKFFTFLIRYIAIPFIYIYFLILYAYTVKVLLNFSDWPKGQVSWMVIGFSFFGYIIYLFSQVVEEKNILINLFKKYFPLVVLPQVAMLFYAIYLRIAQYDITVNRYFVVVFGLWLLGISLYLALSKKKNISYLPLSFGVIIVLISVGPWGVYNFPQTRQLTRLMHNLEVAGIYKDGTIVPLKEYKDIDANLSSEIYEGILYMCEYSDCKQIKTLFKEQIEKPTDVYDTTKTAELGYWQVVDRVSRAIHVQKSYDAQTKDTTSKYIYVTKDYNQSWFPMSASGNAVITQLQPKNVNFQSTDDISTQIDVESQELILLEKGKEVERVSLATSFETLSKKYGQLNNKTAADMADLKVPFAGKKYTGELLLERLSIKNPDYVKTENSYEYIDVSGYAVVRKR